MPEKLDEEKIQDVLDAYEREGTYKGTAEKTGVGKDTVKKYVDRRLKSDDGDSEEDDSDGSSSNLIEVDDGSDDLVDLTDQELMELSESEFIRTFFREFDNMGVRDSFVEMIANQSKVRQKIPDGDQMSQRLQSHNSGIGNANDANMISELYWDLAQRYLNARGITPRGSGPQSPHQRPGAQGSYGGGDWVSAPTPGRSQSPTAGQGSGASGEWLNTNPGASQDQQQSQQPQQGRGGGGEMEQMFQQVMAQQQRMMQTMMEQNQKTEEDRLKEDISELRAEINSSDDDDGDSMTDSLRELMEMREMLNQLEGNNDDDRMEQVVGTLQQQLSALQQEIRDGNSSVDMSQFASGGDSQMGMLMALAQSGNVDPSEMVTLAQQLGEVETNPAVAEKKYEKQIEEMKVQAEQEKWESILGGVEELATSFGDVLAGDLPDELVEDDDSVNEAEPEVTARGSDVKQEPVEEPRSPAQKLVEGGESENHAEYVEADAVGHDEITPDTAPEQTVEAEVVDGGEVVMVDEDSDAIPDDVDVEEYADEVSEEPQTEPEPEPEPDGYPCEFCGKVFDRERQRRGHLANCPERDSA